MESEKRYYSGTVKELLNDPVELRLHMAKMDREHKAEVAELKKEIKRLKATKEMLIRRGNQYKGELKDLQYAVKQGYTII